MCKCVCMSGNNVAIYGENATAFNKGPQHINHVTVNM